MDPLQLDRLIRFPSAKATHHSSSEETWDLRTLVPRLATPPLESISLYHLVSYILGTQVMFVTSDDMYISQHLLVTPTVCDV